MKNKMKKVGLILPALVIALFQTGCKQTPADGHEAIAPVPVKVIEVNAGGAGGALSYSGTIEEDNATLLSFSAAGTIRSLNLSEGQHIAKGQLVGSVDATRAESAYEGAKAVLAQAQDAYNRIKLLYDSKSVPEIKWVEVQSKLQQARSAEQIARKALNDCRLYAPVSGVVSEKMAEVGQNVMPGVPVAKIVSTGSLKARIAVPEGEVALFSTGRKVVVEVGALNNRRFDAVVAEKGVVANPLSRSYEVKFRIQGAVKDLLPGMVATVTLPDAAARPREAAVEQVVIPANVVQIDEDNHTFVWTVRDGKACRVYVECGEFVDDGVVVTSGLSHGDKVIVAGQHKVSSGMAVAVR